MTLAFLASVALSWSHLLTVWRTGTFFDTDDAMRMVQLRAWLAGQGWFDLTAHRLHPPQGVLMHWSRVIDLPLGLLIGMFGLSASPETAERLARIVFPLGCQLGLIVAFMRACRTLLGRSSVGPALVLIVLDGFQFGQFSAGRVDHHAPQIVLLVTLVGAVAGGIRGAGRGAGLVAASAMALSLAISLENLPFFAVAVVTIAIVWWDRGPASAPFVGSFALGMGCFVALGFAATVPPVRYTVVLNDALSLPHGVLATMGGFGWAWLTVRARFTQDRAGRMLSLCGLALLTGGIVLLLCPGFPGSPYANVDPLVHGLWLSHVTEALPFWVAMRLHPAALTLILLPIVSGLCASLYACTVSRGQERQAWAFVSALVATGLLGACWEVRVATSTLPLAALGGVWAVMRAGHARMTFGRPEFRMLLALCPFSPILCALIPVPAETPSVMAATAGAEGCRAASALQPLAGMPAGLAFAPINLGAHLLAHTTLSVLAAPYHRNNAGNRAVLDGFMAVPDVARGELAARAARYVVICQGDAQWQDLVRAAPDGLGAQLDAGHAPPWLDPIGLAETPYRVWRVH